MFISSKSGFKEQAPQLFNKLQGALSLIGKGFNTKNSDSEYFIKQTRPGIDDIANPCEDLGFYAHVGEQKNRVWLTIVYKEDMANSGVHPIMHYPGNHYFKVEWRKDSRLQSDKISTFYPSHKQEDAIKHFISLL